MPSLYEAILGIVGFALVVRFAIVVAFPVIGPGDFDATRQTGFEIRVGLYEVEQLHQAFFIIDRATDRHVRGRGSWLDSEESHTAFPHSHGSQKLA
ncbi:MULTISPECIES: hypothetical protein [unclassified Mesorhizobium]|uniref:hypothetical protein n=1 Tax=unclassified Mesorhizobium TaxID=325217 RepID=UPI0003CF35B6|nr:MULTISPECIES: hypothetical protein [unclassified Mesorhizobium]ESY15755.1 hypothetical protein X750_27315 [Mesorhizobium sp. LNJC394B00]ESZ76470.1 hypothetical protein X726_13410 [Mesorhizobium sp. L103C105A0]